MHMAIKRYTISVFLCLLSAMIWGNVLAAEGANWSREDATHLLRRAGFGGAPAEVDRLHEMGKAAAVDYLIHGKVPPGAEAAFAMVKLADFEFAPAEGMDPKSRAKQA